MDYPHSFSENKSSTDPNANGDMKNRFERPPQHNGPRLNRRQQIKEREINEMSKLSILQELKNIGLPSFGTASERKDRLK